jgi:hypothetical protein
MGWEAAKAADILPARGSISETGMQSTRSISIIASHYGMAYALKINIFYHNLVVPTSP